MSESCHTNLPTSCLNTSKIIDDVKIKIESCIQKYMNLEETMTYLQDKHQINHHVTKLIWEQLQRDSAEFFKDYHLKLEMMRHIKMFNDLLAKQAALMIESGELDISNASSAILKFLSEDPEGTRVLDKIATGPEVNPPSLELAADTNGPTVNQLQIPNNQQNQFQQYQWSTSNIFTDNLGAPTYAPAATDQLFTSHGLPYNYPAASTVAPSTTAQWLPSNNPSYIGASTVAHTATMPQDPFTFGFGGNIGYHRQSFPVTDLPQLVMLPENQLNGQYLPPLQLQNFSQQEQPTLHQYGVINNMIQHGGNTIGVTQSVNQLQHLPQLQLQNFSQQEQPTLHYGVSNNGIQHGGNNIGVMQSENQLQDLYEQYLPHLQLQQPFLQEEPQPLQYEVSNSELQYGGNNNWLQNGGSNNGLQGVIHESEVCNIPNCDDGTLTMPQIQHDLQSQHGRAGF